MEKIKKEYDLNCPKKTSYIKFKCTPEEKIIFQQNSQNAGFKDCSKYLRHIVNNKPINLIDANSLEGELSNIAEELHRIGSNLNQLAKAYNKDGIVNDTALKSALQEYEQQTKILNKAFSKVSKTYEKLLKGERSD